jgi:NAD(P)-dependent dehydrogenase (short-subunit alcohol dehydrogenase family)
MFPSASRSRLAAHLELVAAHLPAFQPVEERHAEQAHAKQSGLCDERRHRPFDDLADRDAVDALVPAVIEAFGWAPTLLVNNASHFAGGGWQLLTGRDLVEAMQVNHHAPIMLARAIVAANEASGIRPAIVNILDQRVVNPVPDQLAYSLSKQALYAATSSLAGIFGGKARINAVAPGLTMPTADYSDAQMERLAKLMPLGALPTPEEIADAVLWLARAEAVTGQTIFVDGGAHLVQFGRDFVELERDD